MPGGELRAMLAAIVGMALPLLWIRQLLIWSLAWQAGGLAATGTAFALVAFISALVLGFGWAAWRMASAQGARTLGVATLVWVLALVFATRLYSRAAVAKAGGTALASPVVSAADLCDVQDPRVVPHAERLDVQWPAGVSTDPLCAAVGAWAAGSPADVHAPSVYLVVLAVDGPADRLSTQSWAWWSQHWMVLAATAALQPDVVAQVLPIWVERSRGFNAHRLAMRAWVAQRAESAASAGAERTVVALTTPTALPMPGWHGLAAGLSVIAREHGTADHGAPPVVVSLPGLPGGGAAVDGHGLLAGSDAVRGLVAALHQADGTSPALPTGGQDAVLGRDFSPEGREATVTPVLLPPGVMVPVLARP